MLHRHYIAVARLGWLRAGGEGREIREKKGTVLDKESVHLLEMLLSFQHLSINLGG